MAATRLDLEKFNGTGDYMLWKEQLMAHLEMLGLHDAISEQENSTDEEETKTVQKLLLEKQRKARSTIVLSLANNVLRKVVKEKTANGMLNTLDEMFSSKDLSNRMLLKQKFFGYKIDSSISMEKNVDEFLKIVTDLENAEAAVSDEDQAIILLMALPEKYNGVKDTLRYGKTIVKVKEVIAAITSKELETGYNAKFKTEAEGLYVSKGKSQDKNDKQGKNKSKKYQGDDGCFVCGKQGHWKKDCPEKGRKKSNDSVNVAREIVEPLVLTASLKNSSSEWVLDSGASFHITKDKELLFDFEEFEGPQVLMGNNTCSQVKGIGKIKITRPNGQQVILTAVRYAPNMSRNLISHGSLVKAGCKYSGDDYRVRFYKKKIGKEVLTGLYREGLYFLEGTVDTAQDGAMSKTIRNGLPGLETELGVAQLQILP